MYDGTTLKKSDFRGGLAWIPLPIGWPRCNHLDIGYCCFHLGRNEYSEQNLKCLGKDFPYGDSTDQFTQFGFPEDIVGYTFSGAAVVSRNECHGQPFVPAG